MKDFYKSAMEELKFILKNALKKTMEQEGLKEGELEFLIQEPQREEYGDFKLKVVMA